MFKGHCKGLRWKCPPVWLGLAILLTAITTSGARAAVSTRDLDQGVQSAVRTEAEVQRKLDVWAAERDRLLEDARRMKYETQWLELQQHKLERYVAANEEKISAMQDAQGQYAIIALGLENALVAYLEKMEAHIAQSAPFLEEERTSRVHFLRQSLNDPELSIGEKYRRFAEGLNAEVEYGKSLELTRGEASLDGERLDLIFVRAGRVGYYCLSMDRNRGGIWDPVKKMFVGLEGEALRAVQSMEIMAQTRQLYNFALAPTLKGVEQ